MSLAREKIVIFFIGLFAFQNCGAFNISPFVKLAATRSMKQYQNLILMQQKVPIKKTFDLSPTMKTILDQVKELIMLALIAFNKWDTFPYEKKQQRI